MSYLIKALKKSLKRDRNSWKIFIDYSGKNTFQPDQRSEVYTCIFDDNKTHIKIFAYYTDYPHADGRIYYADIYTLSSTLSAELSQKEATFIIKFVQRYLRKRQKERQNTADLLSVAKKDIIADELLHSRRE